jgi:uncharacterized iron-regulated protein
MNKFLFFLVLQLSVFNTFAQSKAAFVIYNAQGKKVTYKKVLKDLSKQDIILFGEKHNNPIAHWLQFEMTADLHHDRKLVLGAEMLEADNQEALDEYLNGNITAAQLDTLARLWPNHKTDYAPLVDFARKEQLIFVATNIPRRYANLVYKGGFEALDSLPEEEKSWIAPLPFPFDPELPTYQEILEMMGDHGTPGLVKAQASKDATMAYFILENYKPGLLFIHYNGSYHSDFQEGIGWYLGQSQPDLKIATLSTVSQENVHKLEEEHYGKADFIICVDADMTTTY